MQDRDSLIMGKSLIERLNHVEARYGLLAKRKKVLVGRTMLIKDLLAEEEKQTGTSMKELLENFIVPRLYLPSVDRYRCIVRQCMEDCDELGVPQVLVSHLREAQSICELSVLVDTIPTAEGMNEFQAGLEALAEQARHEIVSLAGLPWLSNW